LRRASSIGKRGFTLLEVLVAVAILGLGLTVILSSQVGLFSSSQRARSLTVAVNLARCRMNETELVLLRDGFQLTDQNDSGACCEDEDEAGFRCSWKVERIELPQATDLASLDGGVSEPAGGLGPLGALAALQGGGATGQGQSPTDLKSMAQQLTSESGGATSMVPLVMSMVYPDLKPMLEASIRRVTVTVTWTEGRNERDLSVTQFVANPMQGGLDPNAAKGLEALDPLNTAMPGATGTTPAAPTAPAQGNRP
jgi:general secretion pathway protein I